MVQKINTLALVLLFPLMLSAQVTFKFSPNSISQGNLKNKMETNISALLTQINEAGKTGGYLDLTEIDMEPEAKNRLQALWEDITFFCNDNVNVKRCLEDYQGYQVRNIPITVKSKENGGSPENRELTISLNKTGTITGVRLAWELQQDVDSMLKGSTSVTDVRQRREILKWVEDFRSYYNEKNLKSLNQIFSDDALIITGSVVTQRKKTGDSGIQYEESVKYKVQNKEEYISNLSRVFKNNAKINVGFDHISIMKHGAKPNIYGVTLHQSWKAGNYHDEGWLFLLWDFNDPEHPQIHVRTWQSEQIAAKDGLFSIDDFFIP